MRKLLITLILTTTLLGLPGCMMPASKLAQYSNPKLAVDYGSHGVHFEAGSDFKGDGKVHVNPATKEIDAEVHVDSSVSAVDKAEGERADHLVELRKIEAAYLVESQRIVGENIKALGSIMGELTGFFKTMKPAPKGIAGKLTQFGESVNEVAGSATAMGRSLIDFVGSLIFAALIFGGAFFLGRYLWNKTHTTITMKPIQPQTPTPTKAPTPPPVEGTK